MCVYVFFCVKFNLSHITTYTCYSRYTYHIMVDISGNSVFVSLMPYHCVGGNYFNHFPSGKEIKILRRNGLLNVIEY